MLKLNHIGRNQSELTFTKDSLIWRVFFSFGEPVAAFSKGTFYRSEKVFSKATSHHVTQWLDNVPHERKPQSFFDNLTN